MTTSHFPHDFELDEFQIQAREAITEGTNVLVAAPTGSGKTVVAEFAIDEALRSGGRVFYTTPIKALSNQKYNDLKAVLGGERVGLLTGDHSLNPEADVVVMTTEVLRNMAYAGSSALSDLQWVVLDEVHFLQDRYRGPVWEEVLIHTPARTRFLCLSATVSNAAQLGAWITSIRGETRTILEHTRPIDLEHLHMVADRQANEIRLTPLLVSGSPNPKGNRFDQGNRRSTKRTGRPRLRYRTPRRTEIVEELNRLGLLPVLFFIFSRKGCDEAARLAHSDGLRLTTAEESQEIRNVADAHMQTLSDADLDVLGYDQWLDALCNGLAAHHAGMVPPFREAVEECFVRGLVKVVFATETLALGINMPARSVVIDKLTKFTGDGHEMLTPAQFTQLSGRAGRRGLDTEGTNVVLWSPYNSFAQTAELAASKEFKLRSVFRPTYNMAANLVEKYDRSEAERVLARSFGQFQADRSVAGNRLELEELRNTVRELRLELVDLTDVESQQIGDYIRLADQEKRLRRNASNSDARQRFLSDLTVGDVIEVSTAKGDRLLVVISTTVRKNRPKVMALTARANPVRLDAKTYSSPPRLVTHVDLPVPHQPNDKSFQEEAAAQLRRINTKKLKGGRQRVADTSADAEYSRARQRMEAHPFHLEPERRRAMAISRDLHKAERRLDRTEKRMSRGDRDLVERFNGVIAVLEAKGMLVDWVLTPAGSRLKRVFHESDLLVGLAMEAGLFDGLEAAGVAAMVSCITHEHRGADDPPPPRLPSADMQQRFRHLCQIHKELNAKEAEFRVPLTREPSAGFASAAFRWCSGAELEDTLGTDEDNVLTGGDFVRNTKQLVDLLRQLGDIAPSVLASRCDAAAAALVRDLVLAGAKPQ